MEFLALGGWFNDRGKIDPCMLLGFSGAVWRFISTICFRWGYTDGAREVSLFELFVIVLALRLLKKASAAWSPIDLRKDFSGRVIFYSSFLFSSTAGVLGGMMLLASTFLLAARYRLC